MLLLLLGLGVLLVKMTPNPQQHALEAITTKPQFHRYRAAHCAPLLLPLYLPLFSFDLI
jgi:hypothetical protein